KLNVYNRTHNLKNVSCVHAVPSCLTFFLIIQGFSAKLFGILSPSGLDGRLHFSYCPVSASSPSSRFSLSSTGRERQYRQGFQRLSGLDGRLHFSILTRLLRRRFQ